MKLFVGYCDYISAGPKVLLRSVSIGRDHRIVLSYKPLIEKSRHDRKAIGRTTISSESRLNILQYPYVKRYEDVIPRT